MCGPESFPAFSLDYLNESITHDNNNIEIFIKRKPLVYTRALRAIQRKKKKREKERLGQ